MPFFPTFTAIINVARGLAKGLLIVALLPLNCNAIPCFKGRDLRLPVFSAVALWLDVVIPLFFFEKAFFSKIIYLLKLALHDIRFLDVSCSACNVLLVELLPSLR